MLAELKRLPGVELSRNEKQEPQAQRGRLAHALRRREVTGRGQGIELAARAGGHFPFYIRCYWGKQGILDGSWEPPVLKAIN